MKVNGSPIELLRPEGLRLKVMEPILLLGDERFKHVDIRVRVKGGGHTSQVYAIRQAIAKSLVAYYQKCESHLSPIICLAVSRCFGGSAPSGLAKPPVRGGGWGSAFGPLGSAL